MSEIKPSKIAAPTSNKVKSGDLPPFGSGFSVNLRFFDGKPECFSKWPPKDLKEFTKLIIKLARIENIAQLQSDGGIRYKLHKGKLKKARFNIPPNLNDKDISLCELRVNEKARIHGFIFEQEFFLLWLDRNHKLF